MTFYTEEETGFELTSTEQMIKKYLEGISDELLNLFWGLAVKMLKG